MYYVRHWEVISQSESKGDFFMQRNHQSNIPVESNYVLSTLSTLMTFFIFAYGYMQESDSTRNKAFSVGYAFILVSILSLLSDCCKSVARRKFLSPPELLVTKTTLPEDFKLPSSILEAGWPMVEPVTGEIIDEENTIWLVPASKGSLVYDVYFEFSVMYRMLTTTQGNTFGNFFNFFNQPIHYWRDCICVPAKLLKPLFENRVNQEALNQIKEEKKAKEEEIEKKKAQMSVNLMEDFQSFIAAEAAHNAERKRQQEERQAQQLEEGRPQSEIKDNEKKSCGLLRRRRY